MGQIKVLVVDDSALARELIIDILSTDSEIKIVGEATNGQEAVKKVQELRPDLITMDIEMPVMDGLEAIGQIMASHAVPILVVTTRGDANTAYTSITRGALDLVEKPDISLENAKEFINKVKLLSKVKVITHLGGRRKIKEEKIKGGGGAKYTSPRFDKVVAIAASTGGPKALSALLPQLPKDFPCPIVVAQHMSDGFIPGLVEWLNGISNLSVKEGRENELVIAGTVYISPSEKHMEINERKKITFIERQPKDIYRPSCDVLLSSVARVYGANSLGVILTGMGTDGVQGIKKIKEVGGITIAQDEKSSIIFGMPRAAINSGYIDKILPLHELGSEIIHLVNR